VKKLLRFAVEFGKIIALSFVELLEIVLFFLVLISPGIIINYKSIAAFFNEGPVDLFMTITGFNIPELVFGSMLVSLKLIFLSIAISSFFGLLIAFIDSFSLDFHWLPSVFVLASAIPVFIISFYLPAVLSVVFLVSIHLMLLSKNNNKILSYLASLIAFFVFSTVTLAYCYKIGVMDVMLRVPPPYLPKFLWVTLGKIIAFSTTATEVYIPYALPLVILAAFIFFAKKYPVQRSLNSFIALGFFAMYGIILYSYSTKIESTYLLAPVLSLAIGNLVIGEFIQKIRHGIAEEMQFDYIKAAFARGASLWVHLRKQIFILLLNTIKSQFIVLLSLTVIVEKIYNIEGMGFLVWEYATQQADIITVSWIVASSIVLVWCFNNIINVCVFAISPPVKKR